MAETHRTPQNRKTVKQESYLHDLQPTIQSMGPQTKKNNDTRAAKILR